MHDWKEWPVVCEGWQCSPSSSSFWFPCPNLLEEWRFLSCLPPSSQFPRSQLLVRQDFCVTEDTVFCCIYIVRHPPSLLLLVIVNSWSLLNLKAFCCVLLYCPHKFCAELNTKRCFLVLSSSSNEMNGKQILNHKAADEVSIYNWVKSF